MLFFIYIFTLSFYFLRKKRKMASEAHFLLVVGCCFDTSPSSSSPRESIGSRWSCGSIGTARRTSPLVVDLDCACMSRWDCGRWKDEKEGVMVRDSWEEVMIGAPATPVPTPVPVPVPAPMSDAD